MRTPLTLQLTTFALTPHPHQITDIVLDKGGDWFNKGGDLAAVCVTPPPPPPTRTHTHLRPPHVHRTHSSPCHPHIILTLGKPPIPPPRTPATLPIYPHKPEPEPESSP